MIALVSAECFYSAKKNHKLVHELTKNRPTVQLAVLGIPLIGQLVCFRVTYLYLVSRYSLGIRADVLLKKRKLPNLKSY